MLRGRRRAGCLRLCLRLDEAHVGCGVLPPSLTKPLASALGAFPIIYIYIPTHAWLRARPRASLVRGAEWAAGHNQPAGRQGADSPKAKPPAADAAVNAGTVNFSKIVNSLMLSPSVGRAFSTS